MWNPKAAIAAMVNDIVYAAAKAVERIVQIVNRKFTIYLLTIAFFCVIINNKKTKGGEVMKSGFKARIYPNEEQEKILFEYCNLSRRMWNMLVERYQDGLPNVSRYGVFGYNSKDLVADCGGNVPERIAVGVLKTYATTCKKYFNKHGGKPIFHKYNPNKQSFYLSSRRFSIKDGYMFFIGVNRKKGRRNLRVDTEYIDKMGIKEVIEPRFTFYKGDWYVSGVYECPNPKVQDVKGFIGLDWGMKNFMTASDGRTINYPKTVLREYQRIGALDRRKSKKKNGSKNKRKILEKISNAYDRFENLKRNFMEQESTALCKNNNIAVENLANNMIKMSTKSKRRNLILYPLYRFNEKLKWKCERFGTKFVMVNPAYTSRTCSCCGAVKDAMPTNIRTFICDACGNEMDRDVNAAINIAARGVCGT